MNQERIHIPYDTFERFAEFTPELSPDERARYRHEIDQLNVGSIILPPYHFDCVKEFSDYQTRLRPGVSDVTFRELTVIARCAEEGLSFTLYLTDGTEFVKLEDQPTPTNIAKPYANFEFVDPVFGSREQDRVQIYLAKYVRPWVIQVNSPWLVRNDAHYERAKQSKFKSWMVDMQEWIDI